MNTTRLRRLAKMKTLLLCKLYLVVLLRCIIMLFYYMKSHVVPDVNRSAFVCMAYVDTIAEACLRLSLPSVCSVHNERTEYRTYVNTWYVLRLEIATNV